MNVGSFDVIGSIAILPLYAKNSKNSAKRILSDYKHIHTILQKVEKVKGRLRTPGLKFIAGKKKFEAIHRESGCLMKLDVRKCFFSPRLSNDRLDISKKVRKGENVLVMFSGIAPYALVIAKNSKAKAIYAIELNRIASKYAQENAKLNKLKNIVVIQGDVKKIIPKLRKKIKFNRIVMARPQLKDTFLDDALKIIKKKGIIHFYDFLLEEEMPESAMQKIAAACKKAKAKFSILGWKKALEIGPRKWRVRVDFRIL